MAEHTALIVVDMQNAFVHPGIPGSEQALAEVNRRVGAATGAIFYTRDIGPFDEANEEQMALHPELDVRGTVVPKGPGRDGGFSGFVLAGTGPGDGAIGPLAALLRESDATTVEVVGVAADVCVAATARDAHRLGYEVVVPLAATAFVHAHPLGDDGAIADLRTAGVTVI